MKSLYAQAQSALVTKSHESFPVRSNQEIRSEKMKNYKMRDAKKLTIKGNRFGRKRMKIADDLENATGLTKKIRKHIKQNRVIGICCKWDEDKTTRRRVSQIQITTPKVGRCILFNLVKLNGVPKKLKIFLEDESILKVGFGITTYGKYLESDFSVHLNNFLDIRYLAIHANTTVDDIYEMAYKTLGFDMRELVKRTEKLNWTTKYLTADQIHLISYECLASYELYETYNILLTRPTIAKLHTWKKQTTMGIPQNKYSETKTFLTYFLNTEYNPIYAKLVPLILKNEKYMSKLRNRDIGKMNIKPKVFPSAFYPDIQRLNAHIYDRCEEKLIQNNRRYQLFRKTFEVVNTTEGCKEVVRKLYRDINKNRYRFLGIDCKYETCGKSRRPVALLLLSTMSNYCAVFKLCVIGEIPSVLKELLEDKSVMKVGFETAFYWSYLREDYGIRVHSILDIQYLARLLNYEFSDLVSLAQIIRKDLSSDGRNHVAPQWNVPSLTGKLLNWALNDVMACLYITRELTLQIINRNPDITRQQLLHLFNSFLNVEYSYFFYEIIKELVIHSKYLPAIKQKVGLLTFLKFEGDGPRYTPEHVMKKARTILVDEDYIKRTTGQLHHTLNSLGNLSIMSYSILGLDDSLEAAGLQLDLSDPAANLDDDKFDEATGGLNLVAPIVDPSDPPLNPNIPSRKSDAALVNSDILNDSGMSGYSIIGNASSEYSFASTPRRDNLNISGVSNFEDVDAPNVNLVRAVVDPSNLSLNSSLTSINLNAPVEDPDPLNKIVPTTIQLHPGSLNSSGKLDCFLVDATSTENAGVPITNATVLPKGCWVLYCRYRDTFKKVRDIEEDKLDFYTHFSRIKPVSEIEINSTDIEIA